MTSAPAHAPHALRPPLRPYQQAALQAIVDARARGVTRPLDYALGVAEDYARRQQAGVLVDPSAAWRQQPPTEKQLALLRKWRVALPPDLTRGAAADLLTAVMGDWD